MKLCFLGLPPPRLATTTVDIILIMVSPTTVEQEPEKWISSSPKKLLAKDIISGATPYTMHWTQVYLQRPEYSQLTVRRLFGSRLKSLRLQISTAKGIAVDEEAALVHDRALFPTPTHNYRGEPRWEGSEAERLLKQDVANGVHKTMTPKELHEIRPEYSTNYSLAVFRGHIYQEVRFVKYCTWRKDSGVKKADEFV
jgi:hypothetical protein